MLYDWLINVTIFPTVSLQLIKTSNPIEIPRHIPKTPGRLSAGGSASVSITEDLPWWWWWYWCWRILDSNKTMGSHNHNNNYNNNSNNNNRKRRVAWRLFSSIAKCVAMPMQILWLPLLLVVAQGAGAAMHKMCEPNRTEPVAVPQIDIYVHMWVSLRYFCGCSDGWGSHNAARAGNVQRSEGFELPQPSGSPFPF